MGTFLLQKENPRFSGVSPGQKEKGVRPVVRPVHDTTKPWTMHFFSRTHAAREAVPLPVSYDCARPQQVWASLVLAALCTGVGDVGPKFDTYIPVRGALEVWFCSFLDQFARKLDGSRITVKIYWSFTR